MIGHVANELRHHKFREDRMDSPIQDIVACFQQSANGGAKNKVALNPCPYSTFVAQVNRLLQTFKFYRASKQRGINHGEDSKISDGFAFLSKAKISVQCKEDFPKQGNK